MFNALHVYLALSVCVCARARACVCVCVCIQVHLKKIEYQEKGQYFVSLISESETQVLYRFITHRVKYFKPLFLEILMIMAYS